MVGVHESDVLLNASSPNAAVMCLLDATKPMSVASPYGPDVQIVADPDPRGHGLWSPAAARERFDLNLFRPSKVLELVARPLHHRVTSMMPIRKSDLTARRSSMAA